MPREIFWTDGTHNYTYDAEDRIIQVDGGQTATYSYDAGGNRIQKVSAAGTAAYLYDLSGHVITELNGSGTWTREEVYAGGKHLATYGNGSSGTTYFVQADWLGTERTRVLPSGDLFETCSSLPFGDGLICNGSADPSPNHLTGKPRDSESNLDYFGARYYSSGLGRFMIPDWSAKAEPVPYAKLENPQSLNLYSYTQDNPLSGVDPDGHACSSMLGNTSSGFCQRADEYGNFDRLVRNKTRFFAAASAVSQELANTAAKRLWLGDVGTSVSTRKFLEHIGQTLEKVNVERVGKILSGAMSGSGPALDHKLVHLEQNAVQKDLDNFKQSDPAGYATAIKEINGLLNAAKQGNPAVVFLAGADEIFEKTDRNASSVLDQVRTTLGRDIDFSNQGDREAIGNAMVDHVRQTGGCDISDAIWGCS